MFDYIWKKLNEVIFAKIQSSCDDDFVAEHYGLNDIKMQISQIEDVKAQVDDLINKVGDRGSALQENSLGQISFIIDSYVQEANNTDDVEKINALWSESQEIGHQVEAIKAHLNVK